MNKQTIKALETLKRLEQGKIEVLTLKIHKIQEKIDETFTSKRLAIDKMAKEKAYADEVGAYLTASNFSAALQDKIMILEEDIEELNADITHLRADLGQRYNRLKTFEILAHQATAEIKSQQNRDEQLALDEMATTTFLRKKA